MNGPLKVPATETTRHNLLDADNRRLRQEIENLPYADIPSALTLASQRLHTLNRFTLPPAKRLQVIAPFHYAFVRFVEFYRNQLSGHLFAREVVSSELDNLLEFIQELGFAYKHIIRDALQRNKQPGGFATVLYMAMLYQFYLGLFSYNRGRMLKRSHWQEFHYLYFLACDMGQQDDRVVCPEGSEGTVSRLYKQALLMGLAAPYSMSADEQWRTADYSARIASQLELVAPTSPDDLNECHWVAADCLFPTQIPGHTRTGSPFIANQIRLLDLSRLLDTLVRQRDSISAGGDLRSSGLGNGSRNQALDLLGMLAERWSRNPQRKAQRHVVDEQIGLVWGLENICAMLDPALRRQDHPAPRPSTAEKRAWSQSRDESSTGLRVKLSGDPNQFPEVGQAIAMIRQRNGNKVLEVGVVRWAALTRDDAPECGIERLPGNVRKVTIQPLLDQGSDRNGLLILKRIEQQPLISQLMTPGKTLSSGAEVSLRAADRPTPLHATLRQLSCKSRNIEVFDINIRGK